MCVSVMRVHIVTSSNTYVCLETTTYQLIKSKTKCDFKLFFGANYVYKQMQNAEMC